ncbi:MAG: DAK2 domain-containing protein [Bacilli bacterium]
MSHTVMDGQLFKLMIQNGAQNLTNHVKYVDSLNVFPVPDGDTGTNMNLTMTSGAKEVAKATDENVGKLANVLSRGLLMGARGNSGVILSQLFRGFARGVETLHEVDIVTFAQALEKGVETAYKAVLRPVEGTILTVAKDTAKKAVELAETETDFDSFFTKMIQEANASLKRTPEFLPVLKEVGVVDSGGQGLVFIYEGMHAALKGETVEAKESNLSVPESVEEIHHAQTSMNVEDLEFGYCTEFMVKLDPQLTKKHPFNELTFRNTLSTKGDSLLVVASDDLVKVHIHAEYPGECLSYAQKFGSLINLKIENMREQHSAIMEEHGEQSQTPQAPKERQPYGIIAVAFGEGIKEMFTSMGASYCIEGGQTMNPSTEQIVSAIEETNADVVYILPNNSNIVMAARQAAEVADVEVHVIPSKTLPQGMAALLAFNPMEQPATNEESMTEALSTVKSGAVTYAVRDTQFEGRTIEANDWMSILEGKVSDTDKDKVEATRKLLAMMINEESEIVTLFQGEDATEEETAAVVEWTESTYPDVEVEVHSGGQPLYSFLISVE